MGRVRLIKTIEAMTIKQIQDALDTRELLEVMITEEDGPWGVFFEYEWQDTLPPPFPLEPPKQRGKKLR